MFLRGPTKGSKYMFGFAPKQASINRLSIARPHTLWIPDTPQVHAGVALKRCASSSSSKRWQSRQGKDKFAINAKVQGLRSRAAFKLLEVDQDPPNPRSLRLTIVSRSMRSIGSSMAAKQLLISGMLLAPGHKYVSYGSLLLYKLY